ncbi:MAG: 30S ribosomal protein S17 [Candidatus Aminicenantes bacterium]|nr:30S ribosomal protein S17 [Candidatus Aminicenantes bacterium]
MPKKEKAPRTLQGVVLSAKAEKTVSVSIERVVSHPVYKKIIKKKMTFLAHDEEKKCKQGDLVTIRAVRPISKQKRWLVVNVVKSTQKVEVPQ